MTRPYFIECETPNLKYRRDSTVTNKPVNLSLVATFDKRKFAWYPDNDGLPGIVFFGVDGKEITHWAYESESVRDTQYQSITGNE